MHRHRGVIAAAVVSAVLAGGVVAGTMARQVAPSRPLNRNPAPAVLVPVADAAAPAKAVETDALGFSRYLPPEIDHYLSMLQAGRIYRSIAESRAIRRLLDAPEAKTFFAELRRELDLQKLPPDGREAIALLATAFESEVTLALPPETMPRAIALLKALGLTAVLFMPTPYPPDSPEGGLLDQKRKPFREAWEKTIQSFQIPPFILAARVREERRFSAFVNKMLDQGRRGFLDAVTRDAPPEIRQALETAWTVETIGGAPLHRFRLRAADLISADALDRALGEMGEINPSPREKAALTQAIRRLSLDIHFGFVGEYLTLVVSSDDRLVRQIAERREGKSADTLAESKSFERIRAALTPGTIGLTYSDGRRTRKELEGLMDLVRQGLDPEFLSLLGAPPQALPMVEQIRRDLRDFMSENDVVHSEGVDILDRGIRSVRRTEHATPRPAAGPQALATLDFIPADAASYYAVRDGSWDGLWRMVQNVIDQQVAALAPLKEAAADDPEMAKTIRRQEALMKRILAPIREKLAPGLRGEMGFILGGTASLVVANAPQVAGIQVPTAAMVVHAADPGKIIEGFRELVRAIAEGIVAEGGGPLPLALITRDADGLEVHALVIPTIRIEGFEPHLARIGKSFVISSSFALTRRIRDTAEGKAPRIASSATHKAMAAYLHPAALEASFMDGGRLQAMLGSIAEGILGAIERQEARPGSGQKARQDLASIRVFVREVLVLVGCFRGDAASTTREGNVDVQTEWMHFSDIESK